MNDIVKTAIRNHKMIQKRKKNFYAAEPTKVSYYNEMLNKVFLLNDYELIAVYDVIKCDNKRGYRLKINKQLEGIEV